MPNDEITPELYELGLIHLKMMKSPILFIEKVYGFKPQRIKKKYKALLEDCRFRGDYDKIRLEMFEPFKKGKHVTWQQTEILLAIERSIRDPEAYPKHIAVKSGHGIGKTCTFSWVFIWFLWCYEGAKIPATAPTSKQIKDVLWGEIKLWINKLPQEMKKEFEWQTEYVKMKDDPENHFGRAATASKENPEALAGVHSDNILMMIDEASGVPDAVFNSARGSMSGPNAFKLMISNPTRLSGEFYDAFYGMRGSHQCMSFSGEESPVVDKKFVKEITIKHGNPSDEYNIRVLGHFPRADALDDSGYMKLLQSKDARYTNDDNFSENIALGVDPAGEGSDTTVFVIRDQFKAKIILEEKISTSKGIAGHIATICMKYKIPWENVYVDSFGVGHDVGQEVAMAFAGRINSVLVSKQPLKQENKDQFINIRAYAYRETRKWILGGGELYTDPRWGKEISANAYKRELSGKIKMMGKQEMKKNGIMSPNIMDALSLTFVDHNKTRTVIEKEKTKKRISRPKYRGL